MGLAVNGTALAADSIVLDQSLNMGSDSGGGGPRVMATGKGSLDGVNVAGRVRAVRWS